MRTDRRLDTSSACVLKDVFPHDFSVKLQAEKTTGLEFISRGVIPYDILTQE